MSASNTIEMFEIACQDGVGMGQFYEKLFHWRFAPRDNEGYGSIKNGSGEDAKRRYTRNHTVLSKP